MPKRETKLYLADAEMVWDISNNELGKLKENLLQFKKIQNIK